MDAMYRYTHGGKRKYNNIIHGIATYGLFDSPESLYKVSFFPSFGHFQRLDKIVDEVMFPKSLHRLNRAARN